MTGPEILAPAGGMDALIAAVRCGADAVYLGGKTLNARRGAGNFDDGELGEAVGYAHARGVRVYLALNTLVADSEIEEAARLIKCACAMGADALILQDIGLARMARELCDIPLHASTQMSVQTAHGLALLRDMGFCRAVLPRELSGDEIAAAGSKIETEVFVHGALCGSVSGQCYLSAVLGGRSGNRGLCAQPCRLPFSTENGTGYDLSLKDLSLLRRLPELAAMGVASFKIEGRMKRPEYVAAAVTACKLALEGNFSDEIFDDLEAVFSRSGFTDGYFTGERGKAMLGVRRREDVTAAAPVLAKLRRLYDKETPRVPVDFTFLCEAGSPPVLTAASGGESVSVRGEAAVSKAVSVETDAEAVSRQLGRCGGTPFYVNRLDIRLAAGLNIPAAEINRLRRDALDALTAASGKRQVSCRELPVRPAPGRPVPERPAVYARFRGASQIPGGIGGIAKVILPLSCAVEDFIRFGAVPEIPRGIFGDSARVSAKLAALKKAGVSEAVCGTLDAFALAREAGLRVIAGYGSNIYNAYAALEAQALGAHECLLSAELTLKQAAALWSPIPKGVFAYGRLPLMLLRTQAVNSGQVLTDRLGTEFPCAFGGADGSAAELLNSVPVYMADKLAHMTDFDFWLLYFTAETKDECAEILKSCFEGGKPPKKYTRGLFYRGVE